MRKTTRDAKLASDEAVKEEERIGEWRLFDHYEDKDGPYGLYVEAPPYYAVPDTFRGERMVRLQFQYDYPLLGDKGFRPLIDTPALFLEFAGLIEEGEITREVWLDWVLRYGVLGFEGSGEPADPWWGNPRGGQRETLAAFNDAARQANAVLRVYEAATSPHGPDVTILSDFASKGGPHAPGVEGLGDVEGKETPAALKEWALRRAWKIVGNIIADHCYPEFYRLKDTFSTAWGFKSLLGAMYLQMMWLMTATGEVRRCQGPGCPRVIAFEQPEKGVHPQQDGTKNDRSGGYKKTRKDKRFCSTGCKSLWHYHYGNGKSTKNSR